MSDSAYAIDLTGDLLKSFSEFPVQLKSYLYEGFVALSNLPQDRYAELAMVGAESAGTSLPSSRLIAARFGVAEQDARALATATSIAISYLIATPSRGLVAQSPERFVQAAAQTGVLPEDAKNSFLSFAAQVVRQRGPISQILERDRLGVQLLPTLAGVQTVVDVRPKFVKGRITFAVPVALIHLATDDSDHDIWFQTTRTQLEYLIKELEDALRRVESAGQWADKSIQPPE